MKVYEDGLIHWSDGTNLSVISVQTHHNRRLLLGGSFDLSS
jgi:hypothetical protein